MLSELTTNAVTFGPGFDIHVSIEVDVDGRVRGEVDDGGFRGVAIGDGDPIGGRGLGLLIVDALTERLGRRARHDARLVRAPAAPRPRSPRATTRERDGARA